MTVLAVTAASGVAALASPTEYTATASLTVAPITTTPFSTTASQQTINITTERAILASREVARMAAAELGENLDPGVLRSNTEVAAPQGSQVLEVSVTSETAEQAARQANALAKAYLDFRAQGADEVAVRYIEVLDEQIEKLVAAQEPGAVDSLRIAELRNQRSSLALVGENPGRIIGQAAVPAAPSSLGWPVYLAGGVAGGTLLGIVLALLRERTDPRVRFGARLAERTGREVVVLKGSEDREALRWVLRALNARTWAPQHGQTIVGLLVLAQPAGAAFTHWLATEALAQRTDCRIVPAAEVDPVAVDAGWPFPEVREQWQGHDGVLVELGGQLSGTRVAGLCENLLGAAVVVADARTRTASALEALQRVRHLEPSSVVLVFLDSPRRSRRHASDAATEEPSGGKVTQLHGVDKNGVDKNGVHENGARLETIGGRKNR